MHFGSEFRRFFAVVLPFAHQAICPLLLRDVFEQLCVLGIFGQSFFFCHFLCLFVRLEHLFVPMLQSCDGHQVLTEPFRLLLVWSTQVVSMVGLSECDLGVSRMRVLVCKTDLVDRVGVDERTPWWSPVLGHFNKIEKKSITAAGLVFRHQGSSIVAVVYA